MARDPISHATVLAGIPEIGAADWKLDQVPPQKGQDMGAEHGDTVQSLVSHTPAMKWRYSANFQLPSGSLQLVNT
jgi:hypothetical protein